jgi:hypothetical protein
MSLWFEIAVLILLVLLLVQLVGIEGNIGTLQRKFGGYATQR